MELVLGSLLLRCDRGMFELFSHARPEPDMRCPVRWFAVAVVFDKRGRGKPKFGTVKAAHAPILHGDVGDFWFTHTPLGHIDNEQASHLRAFLSVIAERYGRRLVA